MKSYTYEIFVNSLIYIVCQLSLFIFSPPKASPLFTIFSYQPVKMFVRDIFNIHIISILKSNSFKYFIRYFPKTLSKYLLTIISEIIHFDVIFILLLFIYLVGNLFQEYIIPFEKNSAG